MVKNSRGPVTYAKMKGIVSYFAGHTDIFRLHVLHIAGPLGQTNTKAKRQTNRLLYICFCVDRASAADFDYLKVIGTGSFGKVLLAKHRDNNRYYAVKVLQKHIVFRKKEEHIMCERSVLLKTVNHPFLVRLHFSFQTKERLYLVMDYAGGGELFYHLQRERAFLEPRARFYAAEIASALGYLHSLHIVYRDLKPENILLDNEGHVVLTDFGLCKEGIAGRATTRTFCGTPEYLAPEVLQQREYDRTVDWWGLGAVLHEMLYGLPPFYSADRMLMLSNIMFQPLVLKDGVSKAGRDLLKRLLNRDRAKRLGAKHDVAELQHHSFFSSIQWDDLVAKKLRPPFIPLLSGPDDLTNIDPAFTNLPVPPSLGVSEEAGTTFPGFSYMITLRIFNAL
uniref:Serum/glucocorticoid regulated kinase 2a n=1 Tax=Astyanax mexicanus TaxID=7994 RepID=W5KDI7_ASTMX